MANQPQQQPQRPVWVRLVAGGAVVLTAWHVLASFLWIAPYSANAREIVPGTALSSYMLPFFGQSWSVFAPAPINGDYHFNVRAKTVDAAGRTVETGWVSATDVELSMIQYTLAPPRAGIQSTEVASGYKAAFDALNDAQQAIVRADFESEGGGDALAAALQNTLSAQPGSGAEGASQQAAVDELLAQQRLSTAYATQVATAMWGSDVLAVQFRVSRQNVVPFAQRHDPDAERPAPTVVLPGWQTTVTEDGQNAAAFTQVFRGQHERMSQ